MPDLTSTTQQIVNTAHIIAKTYGAHTLATAHLLLAIFVVGDSVAYELLADKTTLEAVQSQLKTVLPPVPLTTLTATPLPYTPRVSYLLQPQQTPLASEALLLALIRDPHSLSAHILTALHLNVELLTAQIHEHIATSSPLSSDSHSRPVFAPPTDTLTTDPLIRYGRDLTHATATPIGRDTELTRMVQILSRHNKNNPVLIGEPGVGKTAMVHGLAQRIATGQVPPHLLGKQIISLELSAIVAGSTHRGEFEERLNAVIQALEQRPDVLVFLDDIHTLIGTGGASGSMDASTILRPALSRGGLQVIGATTLDEYRKHIEATPALERRFAPITLDEPSEATTLAILQELRPTYEQHHQVRITDDALLAAVTLSARYINERFLPDKAIDLLDESAANLSLPKGQEPASPSFTSQPLSLSQQKEAAIIAGDFECATQLHRQQQQLATSEATPSELPATTCVDAHAIAQTVTHWTGIPVSKLQQREHSQLMNLETLLHQRIKGQHQAVASVSRAIRRSRTGIMDPGRPVGSFLFLGPTGVGKTELSKALADLLFGSDHAILRLDMSEYMEKTAVSKLIGPPPGYVGYDDGNHFSEKVRRKPYSIVLFDEIEKAHPDIFNLLLQVLEDGTLTDAHGRKVNFKNTVIIMTSNVGASDLVAQTQQGQAYASLKTTAMTHLQAHFAPEFLNRIDDIIVFHPLTPAEICDIASDMIDQVAARVYTSNHLTLTITDTALSHLAHLGYDINYGARPMRRLIQTHIEDRLAEALLDGRVLPSDTVSIDLKAQTLILTTPAKGVTPCN